MANVLKQIREDTLSFFIAHLKDNKRGTNGEIRAYWGSLIDNAHKYNFNDDVCAAFASWVDSLQDTIADLHHELGDC